MKISEFRGKYKFLSNFWSAPVLFDGYEYPTVEHAYQAAKTTDPASRHFIRSTSTPAAAKQGGKGVSLRKDWESVKTKIMAELVLQKFARHPDLRKNLLETGDAVLEEGNTWGDTYWGVCNGQGKNMLGKILMRVRELLGG